MKKDTFDELEHWRNQLRHGIHGIETKRYLLRELYAAAERRGIEVPGYNSNEFTTWLNEPINK